jgi:hypothetical protein
MAAIIIKIEMLKKMLIFGNGGTSWCSQNGRHRHEDSKPQIVVELSSTGALYLYTVFEQTDTDNVCLMGLVCLSDSQVNPKKHMFFANLQ